MQKICSKCNCEVEESASCCPICGSEEFYYAEMGTTAVIDANAVNQAQMPEDKTYDTPQQLPVEVKKKGLKGWQIALIVVGVLALAGIGFIAEKVLQNQSNSDSAKPQSSVISSDNNSSAYEKPIKEATQYTKGTLSDNGVYTNEWADIKFVMPAGYSNADSYLYSAAENSTTDCGMYIMADNKSSFIYICYEKLPAISSYDEDSYLDSVMNVLKNTNTAGVTYITTNTYTNYTVGGYKYRKAECSFINSNGTFSFDFYVRKQDNYMVAIGVSGITHTNVEDLVNKITTVN